MTEQEAYKIGFCKAAEDMGVNPEALAKIAFNLGDSLTSTAKGTWNGIKSMWNGLGQIGAGIGEGFGLNRLGERIGNAYANYQAQKEPSYEQKMDRYNQQVAYNNHALENYRKAHGIAHTTPVKPQEPPSLLSRAWSGLTSGNYAAGRTLKTLGTAVASKKRNVVPATQPVQKPIAPVQPAPPSSQVAAQPQVNRSIGGLSKARSKAIMRKRLETEWTKNYLRQNGQKTQNGASFQGKLGPDQYMEMQNYVNERMNAR